jgi:hypothetical protein
MIILPRRKVVVVATPRTGSRSIVDAIEHGGRPFLKTKLHHEFPHIVETVATDNGCDEIWTMLREPVSQLESWLCHARCWDDPEKFIKTYKSRYFIYEGGMNIYNRIATRFFIYEKNGHEEMIKALGYKDTVKIPRIGVSEDKQKLTIEQIDLALVRFKQDFDLYAKECKKQRFN